MSEGTLWKAAGQSASRLTPCGAVIGLKLARCRMELNTHVGARTLSRAFTGWDPAFKTRLSTISPCYWPIFSIQPLPLPPLPLSVLFFYPRGKEISLSRAPWARAGNRAAACAIASHLSRGARTQNRHFAPVLFFLNGSKLRHKPWFSDMLFNCMSTCGWRVSPRYSQFPRDVVCCDVSLSSKQPADSLSHETEHPPQHTHIRARLCPCLYVQWHDR